MALCSMTGFGQAEVVAPGGNYRVEIKSVNNRFLEIQLRLPKILYILEQKIKQTISSCISRGSVIVYISRTAEELEGELVWDRKGVKKYVDTINQINEEFGLEKNIRFSELQSFADVIQVERPSFDEKKLWAEVKAPLETALEDFQKSRQTEAVHIIKDLKKMLRQLTQTLSKIKKLAPQRIKKYRAELLERIKSLITAEDIDEQRVALEVALMADKLDISEECTRLHAHIDKFSDNLDSDEPVGKRLNFLLQEMNREANTIGSKANDTEVSHAAILLKEYVEKIREQIQNIE